VTVAQILPLRKYAYIDPETVDHVRHLAFFYGGASGPGGNEGWIDYLPSYFSEMPSLIKNRQIRVDVVFTMASPMDEHGYFSISLAADYTMAAISRRGW
jgi:acyl-CoA hydrolase